MSTADLFTPVTGLFGGGLIGLSAAVMLLFSGEILGSSGIASSIVLEPRKHITTPKLAWKLVFMSTFLLFSNLFLGKHFTNDERLGVDPSIPAVSTWGYLLGGLFVGFGTRLGNGCTTGHGICGMARLSLRSIAAVCTFMLSALLTAAAISPNNKALASGTEWLRTDTIPVFFNRWLGLACSTIFFVPTIVALYYLLKKEQRRRSSLLVLKKQTSTYFPKATLDDLLDETNKGSSFFEKSEAPLKEDPVKEKPSEESEDSDEEEQHEVPVDEKSAEEKWHELRSQVQHAQKKLADGKIAPAAFAAILFALGLAISQMVLPSKVLGFLALYTLAEGTYDPTLLTVMIGGALVSFLSYQFVDGWGVIKNPWATSSPYVSSEFCVPTNSTIDWKLLAGATCFGIGWAIAGLCPGPATFLAASGTKPVLAYWWPLYFVGAFAAQKLKEKFQ